MIAVVTAVEQASEKVKHLYSRSRKDVFLAMAASSLKFYMQMSLLCLLVMLS